MCHITGTPVHEYRHGVDGYILGFMDDPEKEDILVSLSYFKKNKNWVITYHQHMIKDQPDMTQSIRFLKQKMLDIIKTFSPSL